MKSEARGVNEGPEPANREFTSSIAAFERVFRSEQIAWLRGFESECMRAGISVTSLHPLLLQQPVSRMIPCCIVCHVCRRESFLRADSSPAFKLESEKH